MVCPRCSTPLTTHTTSSAVLQGCLGCGGIFLDRESRAKVVASLDVAVAQASDLAAAHARISADTAARIACPVCRAPMNVTRVAAGSFDLDVCDLHGAWFDRNELRLLLDALGTQQAHDVAAERKHRAKSSKGGHRRVSSASAAAAASSPKKRDSDPPASSSGGVSLGDVADIGDVAIGTVAFLLELIAD